MSEFYDYSCETKKIIGVSIEITSLIIRSTIKFPTINDDQRRLY